LICCSNIGPPATAYTPPWDMLGDALCAEVELPIQAEHRGRLARAEEALSSRVSKQAWDCWREVEATLTQWHTEAMRAAFNYGINRGIEQKTAADALAGLPDLANSMSPRYEARHQRQMRIFADHAGQPGAETGQAMRETLTLCHAQAQSEMCRRGWQIGNEMAHRALQAAMEVD